MQLFCSIYFEAKYFFLEIFNLDFMIFLIIGSLYF